jgi:DNA-binding beta-propeller fold protein YncE
MRIRTSLKAIILLACTTTMSPSWAFFDLFSSNSIAAGSRYAFIPSKTEARIVVIDTQSDELAAELELNDMANQLVISDSLDMLVATHSDSSILSLLNLETQQLLPSLDIGMIADTGLLHPHDQIMAFGNTQGQVSVWDMQAPKKMFQVDGLSNAVNLTFSVDGAHLFVVEPEHRRISVIELNARAIIAEIGIPKRARNDINQSELIEVKLEISSISRSADGHTGFLSITSENTVVVLDLRKLEVKQTIAVDAEPVRPFSTADNRYVLIPHRAAESIYVLDALSLNIRGNIKTGLPARELNTGWLDTVAFVMSANSEQIAVVDLEKLALERTITLSGNPDSGMVTSDSKRLYTALIDTNRVARIDVRSREVLEISSNTNGLSNIEIAVSNNICH